MADLDADPAEQLELVDHNRVVSTLVAQLEKWYPHRKAVVEWAPVDSKIGRPTVAQQVYLILSRELRRRDPEVFRATRRRLRSGEVGA